MSNSSSPPPPLEYGANKEMSVVQSRAKDFFDTVLSPEAKACSFLKACRSWRKLLDAPKDFAANPTSSSKQLRFAIYFAMQKYDASRYDYGDLRTLVWGIYRKVVLASVKAWKQGHDELDEAEDIFDEISDRFDARRNRLNRALDNFAIGKYGVRRMFRKPTAGKRDVPAMARLAVLYAHQSITLEEFKIAAKAI